MFRCAEVYLEAQEPEKALDWIKKVPPEMALEDYKRDKLLLDIYRKTNNQEKLAEVAENFSPAQRRR